MIPDSNFNECYLVSKNFDVILGWNRSNYFALTYFFLQMKLNNKYKLFSKILIILFLTSCSETTFLINSAKKMSKWDEDPMYKVGNPYKINGKWYYPAIDYDYNEVGIASWYGPGFHGKKRKWRNF